MPTYKELYSKALDNGELSAEEGTALWDAPLPELMFIAHTLRQRRVPGKGVTWQIDRNINITNVCCVRCLFCNFHAGPGGKPYVTTKAEYREKINGLLAAGGDQVLLQGGLNPTLSLQFYVNLFQWLKQEFPAVKLHALGPAEVLYLAQQDGRSVVETLKMLIAAGLDSLPGAGAEILSDRTRQIISPRKISTAQWLDVMRSAQQLGLLTSATMMYGHQETISERMEHLVLLRNLKAEHSGPGGFMAFIPWPFQGKGTALAARYAWRPVGASEHLRMVALARIMLPNVPHIQSSWLTVGPQIGLMALHYGADDMGSIMLEEHVLAAAGTHYRLDKDGMRLAIRQAGFTPILRDQAYRPRADCE